MRVSELAVKPSLVRKGGHMKWKIATAAFATMLLTSARTGAASPEADRTLSIETQISTCAGIGCTAGPEWCAYMVDGTIRDCAGGPQRPK